MRAKDTTEYRDQGSLEAIPDELRERDSFVAWKLEERDGDFTKVPYDAKTGRKADTTDSRTWAAFSEVLEVLESGGYDGVGYVFSSGDPFAGIDLDNCRDPEDASIALWAEKIIDALDGYVEISPSGRGVHIIVNGKAPNRRRGPVEAYSSERFFTMTGDVLEGSRREIPERRDRLNAVLDRVFAEQKAETNGHAGHLADEEIIERCRKARNAAKFVSLFDEGDTSAYGGDDSRADLALVSLLAFYTQEHAQIDRLFRQSALYREKWERGDYRQRTMAHALGALAETYSPPQDDRYRYRYPYRVGNGNASEDPRPERRLRSRSFVDMEAPEPRGYLVEGLVPEGYPAMIYGDGGVAKSMLVLSLGLAVSHGGGCWLGHKVSGGDVLYLDFELDADEQNRRVNRLARAEGLEKPPAGLRYMSALGYQPREVFECALEECKDHEAKLLILDSLGIALEGDVELARDVIGFYQRVLEPFRAEGITVLVVDHQSKLQSGERYQSKRAFGSVFKPNLARSVVQVEATERHENTLSVRLRHNKANFGPLVPPFGAKLGFSEEMITVEAVEIDEADLASEDTLSARTRVVNALATLGEATPSEINELTTGLTVGTVKKELSKLRKDGTVEETGKVRDRAHEVRLAEGDKASVTVTDTLKGNGNGNASEAAAESGLWEGAL